MRAIFLVTTLFLCIQGYSQKETIFAPSELIKEDKLVRNLGLSFGYNPFPQEFLFNMDFRASQRFSPFIGLEYGFEELRSDPVIIGQLPDGSNEYQMPIVNGNKAYYQCAIGYRINFGRQGGNYSALVLDLGLQVKLAGDSLVDYYNLLSRIGYRLFFTERLYFLASAQFDFSARIDNWFPEESQYFIPDLDVDLLTVRVGYQF